MFVLTGCSDAIRCNSGGCDRCAAGPDCCCC
uniref:Pco116203 n=1 Tax=Arundo donax TaxID=35708 RepID=A0A0A9F0P5_ARUDO